MGSLEPASPLEELNLKLCVWCWFFGSEVKIHVVGSGKLLLERQIVASLLEGKQGWQTLFTETAVCVNASQCSVFWRIKQEGNQPFVSSGYLSVHRRCAGVSGLNKRLLSLLFLFCSWFAVDVPSFSHSQCEHFFPERWSATLARWFLVLKAALLYGGIFWAVPTMSLQQVIFISKDDQRRLNRISYCV